MLRKRGHTERARRRRRRRMQTWRKKTRKFMPNLRLVLPMPVVPPMAPTMMGHLPPAGVVAIAKS
jgi:hypothetical protein